MANRFAKSLSTGARFWSSSLLFLGCVCSLGCQARQMVDHYLSFDAVVTDLYERHVLYNLARRDRGRTMVQMEFRSFSANLSYSTSMSTRVKIFADRDVEGEDDTTVSFQAFRQSFEPNISLSGHAGLGISAGPGPHQDRIRALYDEQVSRPVEERIYRRTRNPADLARAYSWIRTGLLEWYYVPKEKQREFCDFVHRVCFYKPTDDGSD